jgi:histidine phosphotransferase ChpT
MAATFTLDGLDLAALLCSRLCHDLISPVGAIVNGIEVIDETEDESTKTFALDLIKRSAAHASAKLQFCRIAFGSAGSSGATIDLGDAETVTRGLIEDDKTALTWLLPRALLPKDRVKLLLNMVLLAAATIPRGGTITVDHNGEDAAGGFRLTATGAMMRLPQAMPALVSGTTEGPVDAHGIQPFYAGLLARTCGFTLSVEAQPDRMLVVAA